MNVALRARREPVELRLGDEAYAQRNGNGEHHPHALRALVSALPERRRLVLFLRYYADLDYCAIATALEIRTGTVSATLHAAHAALRQALEQPEEVRR